MVLHYGDLTDSTNLVHIVSQVLPTEIYNLGAQSHVKVSFDMAEYTVSKKKINICNFFLYYIYLCNFFFSLN